MRRIQHNRPSRGIQVLIDDLFNQSMSDVFGTHFTTTQSSVNIWETEDDYRFDFAAPGLNKKDFSIQIHKSVLNVSVDLDKEPVESTESLKRKEFSYLKFDRSFQLPELADEDKISASYKNGILSIKVGKKDVELIKSRKIEIA